MFKIRKAAAVLLVFAAASNLLLFPVFAGEEDAGLSSRNSAAPVSVIYTAEQLAGISDMSGSYVLAEDIDLTGIDWIPIGSASPFTGEFDGAGFTIRNLTLSENTRDYAGLFGMLDSGAAVKNLKLEQVEILCSSGSTSDPVYAGALAGSIRNAYAADCTVIGGTVEGSGFAGGLIGFSYGGTVEQCSADISVKVTESTGQAGGLIGGARYGTVSRCFADGSVSGGSCTGGLIGSFDQAAKYSFIENCFASGDVSSSQKETSGTLVGLVTEYVTSTGNDTHAVRNCYTNGTLEGTGSIQTLLGAGSSGIPESCYMKAEAGNTDPSARTTEEMKQSSTFQGWDFAGVWQIEEGISFPSLQWASSQDQPRLILSDLDLAVGERVRIQPVFLPADAESPVTYQADDSSIAAIDENGYITGRREGTTSVTGTSRSGLSDTFTVTVTSDSEAVYVSNAREFEQALKNKSVQKICFANDIVMDRSVTVQASRDSRQLIIDGCGYRLTENYTATYSTSLPIKITSRGTLDKVTLMNMNITGQNGYGTIYVAASVSGLVQEYINVDYCGPQITYNRNGTAYYKDSSFVIGFAEGGKYAGELAEVNKAVFAGNVTITKEMDTDGVNDKVIWLTGTGGGITIEPDGSLTVNNLSHGRSNSGGFVYADSRYGIDVGQNARFHYSGYEQFMECAAPSSFTAAEGADVSIKIQADDKKGFAAGPIVTVNGNMTIGEQASFLIETWGNLAYAMLRVNGDLLVSPGSDFRLVSHDNQAASPNAPLLVMNGGTAYFNNPENLLIYNSNNKSHSYARAVGYAAAGTIRITTDSIKVWHDASAGSGPEALRNPSASWKQTGEPFTVEGGVRAGTNGTFRSFSVDGYDGEDLTADTFNLVKVKILQVNGPD